MADLLALQLDLLMESMAFASRKCPLLYRIYTERGLPWQKNSFA